jgi:hypothetical protein
MSVSSTAYTAGYLIWLAGLAVLTLVYAWGHDRFLAGLRDRHHAEWQRLGEPTFATIELKPVFDLVRYIALGEYKRLEDTTLRLTGDAMRYSVVCVLVWGLGGMTMLIRLKGMF